MSLLLTVALLLQGTSSSAATAGPVWMIVASVLVPAVLLVVLLWLGQRRRV